MATEYLGFYFLLFLLEKRYRRENLGWATDKLVWNPSIRKFHDIPSSPGYETSPDSSFKEADIGLGYDPLVKDYKYVKLVLEKPNITPMVAIYTLGCGSWKMIPFQGKGFSDFEWDIESISSMTVYLRGILYFLVIHVEMDVLKLVSFDLRSEVFDFIDVPDDVAHISQDSYPTYPYLWVTLVRYGCSSLAVLDFEDCTSIWVLEIESMCWAMPYSLDLVVEKFLYLKKNRDILMWWSSEETSFSLATGNRLEQWWCSLVSSYNLETRKEKILMLQKGNKDFYIYKVYGYIESLVLLK